MIQMFIPDDGTGPTSKLAQLTRPKIAYLQGVFKAFNQIMKHPVTFQSLLIFFDKFQS